MSTGFFLDEFYKEVTNPIGTGAVMGNAAYRKEIGTDAGLGPIYLNLGQQYANKQGRLFGFSAAFKAGPKASAENWNALYNIKDELSKKSGKGKAQLILDTILASGSSVLNENNRGTQKNSWFYAQNFQVKGKPADTNNLYSQVAAILWAAKTLYPDIPVFPVFDAYLMKSSGLFTIDKIKNNLSDIGLGEIIKTISQPVPKGWSNWNILSTLYHSDLINGFIGDSFKLAFEGKLPITKTYPSKDPDDYALPFFHETSRDRPTLPYAVDSKYAMIENNPSKKVNFEYSGKLYNLGDTYTKGNIPLDSSLYVPGGVNVAKGYDATKDVKTKQQPIGFGLNNELKNNDKNSTISTENGDYITSTMENNGTVNVNGMIHNYGDIINNGLLNLQGSINSFYGDISNNGTISGSAEIKGNLNNAGVISPGNSAGGLLFDGDLTHGDDGSKIIELGGDSHSFGDRISTEYDFIDVTGDIILDGGKLEVEMINCFELGADQAFVIAKADGNLIGEYNGLKNGEAVGEFNAIGGGMIALFISYDYNENEITLFTQ